MPESLKSPLFSIIVPVYNVKKFVSITIDSILSQTFTDFELIAVDDGSTDGSGEQLDMIATEDSRVKVFHQDNSGVSAARNLGLDQARGEWIVFVDGDDALRQNALEVISQSIKRHPSADLIGYRFDKVGSINSVELNRIEGEETNNEIAIECSQRLCFGALDHYMVWTETFRRDILGDLRFKPLKNGEDVLFCNGLAYKANCYVALGARLYLYIQREASAKRNSWTSRRQEDYISLHNGILENISMSKKVVNQSWLKRWVGTLLQYTPEAWNFEKSIQKEYFSRHRVLLKRVGKLMKMPHWLRLWIFMATLFNSKDYFKIVAMKPMNLYSKLIK